jgi:hypothetical protein
LQSNKFVVGSLTQNKKKKCFLFISHEETTSFVPPLLGLGSFSPQQKNKNSQRITKMGNLKPQRKLFSQRGKMDDPLLQEPHVVSIGKYYA